jgi:nucleoside phosphorylase
MSLLGGRCNLHQPCHSAAMTKRIGIIAALPEEAAAFFPDQGTTSGDLRHLIVSETELHIRVSGIGKVNAAIAATQLALGGCGQLLVIGTAGRISAKPGACFWIAQALQHDYGAQRSGGMVRYAAGSIPIGPAHMTPYAAMADPGIGLPHALMASGDSFVEDPALSATLANDLGVDLVDMETAAIAQVAQRLGLPWAAIRAVSDDANAQSGVSFRDNLARAAREAGVAAERLISLL